MGASLDERARSPRNPRSKCRNERRGPRSPKLDRAGTRRDDSHAMECRGRLQGHGRKQSSNSGRGVSIPRVEIRTYPNLVAFQRPCPAFLRLPEKYENQTVWAEASYTTGENRPSSNLVDSGRLSLHLWPSAARQPRKLTCPASTRWAESRTYQTRSRWRSQ